MSGINSLASRIDAEFSAIAQKIKKFQSEQIEEHKERQKRLEQLGKVFDDLRAIWRPRLELLLKKFEGACTGDSPNHAFDPRSDPGLPVEVGSHPPETVGLYGPGRSAGNPELRPGDHSGSNAIRSSCRSGIPS